VLLSLVGRDYRKQPIAEDVVEKGSPPGKPHRFFLLVFKPDPKRANRKCPSLFFSASVFIRQQAAVNQGAVKQGGRIPIL
jgi:hypothetical protein